MKSFCTISIVAVVVASATAASVVWGAPVTNETSSFAADQLNAVIVRELRAAIPGARVELSGGLRWQRVVESDAVANRAPALARLTSEDGRGNAAFSIRTKTGETLGVVETGFSAWIPALFALRRIHPGEKLSREMFRAQEVNVASGLAREYRGAILVAETDVSKLETLQTILEGQFAVSNAVRKMPDIRRGESVRVRLISGGVTLMTSGVAEEPAYIDAPVRVMSARTKHQLSGKLREGGVVEVRL